MAKKNKSKMSSEEINKKLRNRARKSFDERDNNNFGRRILNLEKYKDVKFFKPEANKEYAIDIIPFLTQTDIFPEIGEGEPLYTLEVWVHKNIGEAGDDFICPKKNFKKPCPICQEWESVEQNSDQYSEKQYKDLKGQLEPKKRNFYNIIDLDDKDQAIQMFEVSYHLFEKELSEAAVTAYKRIYKRKKKREKEDAFEEQGIIGFSEITDGYTILFETKNKKIPGFKSEFVIYVQFAFEKREEDYEVEILNDSYPLDALLNLASYEEIEKSLQGSFADVEEDDDSEEEETAEEKPKKRRNRERQVEEDDEIEEEEPKRKRKAKSEKNNECPFGHIFGDDCDDTDECDICDIWDECEAAN